MALTTKHQVLAWDLVEGLEDEAHKGIYFRLAKIYDETFLRRILAQVREAYKSGKIEKESCGKYFMGILKKELQKSGIIYEKNKTRNYPRRRSRFKKESRACKKSKIA